MASQKDENNAIIRFDLKLPAYGPRDCPRELWLDHAIVQETSPTYREQTLEFLDASADNNAAEGPAFHKAFGAKQRKYAPLISVVNRRWRAQARFLANIFVPNHFLIRVYE